MSALRWGASVAALSLAAPAAADDRRDPPDYYIDTVNDFSAAVVLTSRCATLSLSLDIILATEAELWVRLEADGFDKTLPDAGMTRPHAELITRSEAFFARYGLDDGSSEADFCAAGLSEIASGSQLGSLMTEAGE